MNNAQFLLKKYSPTILTSVSIIGVISTTILGIKATPKALKLINEAENKKGVRLTNKEIVKVAWKPYIPTTISCVTTITTILSLHILTAHTQTALVSAYATLNQLHNEYVNKTKELYGEDADEKVKEEIAKEYLPNIKDLTGNLCSFLDFQSLRPFESTIENVLKAENQLNEEFAANGFVTINDFYRLLGLEPVSYGNEIGWYDRGTFFEIKFENQRCIMDVGDLDDQIEVFIINPITEPNASFNNGDILIR